MDIVQKITIGQPFLFALMNNNWNCEVSEREKLEFRSKRLSTWQLSIITHCLEH